MKNRENRHHEGLITWSDVSRNCLGPSIPIGAGVGELENRNSRRTMELHKKDTIQL